MYIVARENKEGQCGELRGGMLAKKGLLFNVCKGMVRDMGVLCTVLLPACNVVDPDMNPDLHGSASFW
jgi:hypothetical protein